MSPLLIELLSADILYNKCKHSQVHKSKPETTGRGAEERKMTPSTLPKAFGSHREENRTGKLHHSVQLAAFPQSPVSQALNPITADSDGISISSWEEGEDQTFLMTL
ncbi:hypothetical protein J6590_027085 [Homalodisca vitripennis]|nr:hypothetical protein J6590_027085 [Homalodisca vitripennis]